MAHTVSFRRVRMNQKQVLKTLEMMRQQLDTTHDAVCEEVETLFCDVQTALHVANNKQLAPESALALIRETLSPWISSRMEELRLYIFAMQAFWQQDLKSIRPDLQSGAAHMIHMESMRHNATQSRAEKTERRHALWLKEAHKCLDANPKWKNWRIAGYLVKQFRIDSDFQVGKKAIYDFLQEVMPRR